MKKIRGAILLLLPLCFWLMVMLSFDDISICILTLLAVSLHEIGHIGAYIFLKRGKITLPRAAINGLKIHTGGGLSYFEELIITLFGPLVNILVFLLLLPFSAISHYLYTFGIINLLCAISNLLPIRGYDGYGILNAYLSLKYSLPKSEALEFISIVFTSLITITFSLTIFITGEGYWIFAVFFIHLLKEILKSHR